ncbi:hypothetical protein SGJ94_002687 [Salmonella enterica]|nr:hypothetical protein [Salmonella enterica]
MNKSPTESVLFQRPDWHVCLSANPVSGLVLEKSVVKAVVGIHHLLQWTISSEEKVAEKSTTNPFNAQQTT